MSIKARLRNLEKKAGTGDRPTVFWMRTFCENNDGTAREGFCSAFLQQGKTYLGTESTTDGETFKAFEARVREWCFELTGKYPQTVRSK